MVLGGIASSFHITGDGRLELLCLGCVLGVVVELRSPKN